jgi:DNA-binding NarL/FixJ family response regulator
MSTSVTADEVSFACIRLVLCDDHRVLRESLRRSLEAQGFAVVGEARDGVEAVELAVERKPDVVLMDVTMPTLDGIEATRRIRQLVPEVRVVMLTMHDNEATMAQALRMVVNG